MYLVTEHMTKAVATRISSTQIPVSVYTAAHCIPQAHSPVAIRFLLHSSMHQPAPTPTYFRWQKSPDFYATRKWRKSAPCALAQILRSTFAEHQRGFMPGQNGANLRLTGLAGQLRLPPPHGPRRSRCAVSRGFPINWGLI